jgi:hypothetical protein
MAGVKGVGSLGRLALAVLLSTGLSAHSVMAADDAGVGAFFRDQFGIGADPTPPAPVYDEPVSRPLIVRPHRRPQRAAAAKIVVGPVAPVSIYNDRTLKVGDAVMTAKGLRVFVGGHGAPYTDADFLAVSDVDGLPKQVQKALLIIDKAPRT